MTSYAHCCMVVNLLHFEMFLNDYFIVKNYKYFWFPNLTKPITVLKLPNLQPDIYIFIYKVPQIYGPVAMYFKSGKRVRQAARSFQNTFIVRHKSRNEPNLIYFKKMPWGWPIVLSTTYWEHFVESAVFSKKSSEGHQKIQSCKL